MSYNDKLMKYTDRLIWYMSILIDWYESRERRME